MCWGTTSCISSPQEKAHQPLSLATHSPPRGVEETLRRLSPSVLERVRKAQLLDISSKNTTADVCKHPCANTRGLLLDYLTLSKYILRK